MIYSTSAVRRILKLDAAIKVRIEVWKFSVWVWVQGMRPTFLSKRVFLKHFADWRRQQAQNLIATQHLAHPARFTVRNRSKGTAYVAECRAEGVRCSCEDYRNQVQFLGKGICKHGYAVLAILGLSTLSSYLAAVQQRQTLSQSASSHCQ